MQKVVPAILTKDPAQLQSQLEMLQNNTKWVQIDVMDGKFVPAISANISQLQEAYQFFNLSIHLMVQDPQNYLEDCSAAGAKRVYFHVEGTENAEQVLSAMEKYPFQKGVALNPETGVEKVAPFAKKIDAVLLLSVVPGVQGHEFIAGVTEKIPGIRALNQNLMIGMDGGIDESNIAQVFSSGVDYVAVGSGIWKTKDPIAALKKLEEMVN